MGPEEEVGIRVGLKDRRETAAGLDEIADKENRIGDEAARAGRKAKIGAGGFITLGRAGRLSGRAVLYGMGAMSAGIIGAGIVLGKFTKDSIQGWEDHRKVAKLTQSTIIATGGAANLTARQVGTLSDALERKTGVDGDVIQSGANMLLTFKNIRNEAGDGNDIFTQSLGVLNDMSAFMKTDASKSAVQLGKALNDPVKGVSALTKVGVTFTDAQKDQIDNFVEQNKMAEAQKIILGELSSEFGGAAKAQMTMGDQVMVGYHQLQDTIGKALLPLERDFQRFLVNEGIPAAQHYADIFVKDGVPVIEKYAGLLVDKGVPAVKGFLDEARPLAKSVLPAIGSALGTTRDVVDDIAPKLKTVFDGFNDLPDWAKEAIIIGAGGAAVASKLGAGKLLGRGAASIAGTAITKAKPLPVWVVNNGVGGGVGGGGGTPVVGGPGGGMAARAGRFGVLGDLGLVAGAAIPALGFGLANAKYEHPGTTLSVDDERKAMAQYAAESKQIAQDNHDAIEQLLIKPLGKLSIDGPASLERVHAHIEADTKSMHVWGDATRTEFDRAENSANPFLRTLKLVDGNYTPKINIQGLYTAEQHADALKSKLAALTNAGVLGNPGPAPPNQWDVLKAPKRAGGGPVSAGHPYIVGDRGPRHAWEVFVPKVDGVILPNVDPIPNDFGAGGFGGLDSEPIHVHLHVDGREMAEVVIDRLKTKAARG